MNLNLEELVQFIALRTMQPTAQVRDMLAEGYAWCVDAEQPAGWWTAQ